MKLNLGDMVILKGRRSNFYEVIKVEENYVWVSDGWIQAKSEFSKLELICNASDRKDKKVPLIPFINC